ncbi:hypothetical protein C8Q76DRAFT_297214 [Earliella scabrosa]|nr:hypothetical protein C8Q76DRAFT_297214 [Earliella scabrosa]
MNRYRELPTKAARDEFAKRYATRWSELARLPYFDMCRMIVIDPMHNLFLGLVKTHFYHIWVQLKIFRKNHELRKLHEVLDKLSLPTKLGRLPRLVGEPAGGSLTADQWLIMATVVGPLAIPELWSACEPDPDGTRLAIRRSQIEAAVLRKREKLKSKDALSSEVRTTSAAKSTRRKGKRSRAPRTTESGPLRRSTRPVKLTEKAEGMVLESDDDGAQEVHEDEAWPSDEDEPMLSGSSSLHPRDVANFAKLCSALRIFLSEELSEADVSAGDRLLREYCIELLELYGPSVIRPNHHYATHTGDFVLDYGPLREFWTFIFERMNRILKSYKTSNHEGGEIECTFFREFHRSAELYRLVCVNVTIFSSLAR